MRLLRNSWSLRFGLLSGGVATNTEMSGMRGVKGMSGVGRPEREEGYAEK
jgi:hypothetical protein